MAADPANVSQQESWDTDAALLQFYDELRQLARSLIARESAEITLQATALVHEAYLRIGGPQTRSQAESKSKPLTDAEHQVLEAEGSCFAERAPTWENRAHFFGAAAEAMRRVLVDRARRHGALKRGGCNVRADVDVESWMTSGTPGELVSLNDALEAFEAQHPEKASIVKLRYFVGLSVIETAQMLSISTATVKRHWAFAKAWLRREMSRS